MKRLELTPRDHWREIVRSQGLLFHTNASGAPYWDESACFVFSPEEMVRLEKAANELHGMFLRACRMAILDRRLGELGIPECLHDPISKSWRYDDWELYGRFDFTLDAEGTPKLLEYNADTPTGLLEASLIQWYWKEEVRAGTDQFNSLHESLIERWQVLLGRDQLRVNETLYLSSVGGHIEDRMTVGYIGETAELAGLKTQFLPINMIGWNEANGRFVDVDDKPIRQLFKLYPWSWMAREKFSQYLRKTYWQVLEPPWKALCNCKSLLLLLQELYPGHPNLLRVSTSPENFASYARKPIFGREGGNIEIVVDGTKFNASSGPYGDDRVIYQEYCPLIQNGSHFAQLGVWMVGTEACGLGVREDSNSILRSISRFVPHFID